MPTNPLIKLIRSTQSDDSSAMSIVNNKNSKIIEDALNNLQAQIDQIGTGTGGTITQDQFNVMLDNAKNYLMIRADMVNGATVDFNGYRLTRVGPPSGSPAGMEFRITDTDTVRNTNFRKSVILIRDFAGYYVYPSILADSTFISIIFSDSTDVNPSIVNPLSDPNNKRLIIL